MSPQAGNKVETYCQAWISSLALLLSRMAAADWQVESLAAPTDYAPAACLRIAVEGGLSGQQWLSFAAADLAALLQIFLGEEVSLGAELDDMQREAIEELIRQWSGLAATALKTDFDEVTLQVASESPVRSATGLTRLFRAADPTRSIAAVMELSDALVAALVQPEPELEPEPEAAPAAQAESEPAPSPSPPPMANVSPRIEELLRRGNLELLMDVELAVMLRFGSRQATLHEVLDLATGAVLELDREIQEPVDLVLNNRVIARGEVVVVDGNYGLRVLEVASPQQRVSSL
jgi:flagellar motor switch protein FliN